ncbi:MAG: tyrosine recombinase XerD [Mycoplasmataceae bacterium CE_OT135]|nr:MAG: tyrosine recombinase XerD [Mycoplasmataceae bacterium CE_OT135]KLL04369.1 MAG: tyrosine recombinase XerD [Mycoplasmataceae bacterium CE_OT135]
MLPNLPVLERINQKIQNLPNQHGEYKRKTHYGLFLLCQKAGLRVSEAINFDLSAKTQNGLYRIKKSKGKKEKLVYIPQEVISELKKHNWQPNRTNRFNFYHFLKRIKQELNLPTNNELTPHTLRRTFATYHAEAGLPLPLLQKLLGHQSIRTTALYWRNIYNEDGDDTSDILTGKNWLEKPKKSQPEPATLIKVKLNGLPELSAPNLPLFSPIQAEHLSKISQLEKQLSQIQRENNNLKSENADLRNDLRNSDEQNAILGQAITEKDQIIKQLSQDLTNERAKTTAAENNLAHEKEFSAKQEQTINDLRQQLQAEQENNHTLQETNAILTQKINQSEQNHTNLQKAYQQAIKDKQNIEQQLNQLTTEIKNLAKTLHQWQKINYYQQLAKEQNEFKAQIIHPPPWKKT